MSSYVVILNSLSRIREGPTGITSDYHSETLRTFSTLDAGIDYCKRYRPKLKEQDRDTLYIEETTRTSANNVYYLSAKKEVKAK